MNNSNFDPDFCAYYFDAGMLNSQLRLIVSMGARAHGLLNVLSDDFFEMTLTLPSLLEQQKIATVLTAANEEIEAFQKSLEKLLIQKSGLMQKLLTGEIRV